MLNSEILDRLRSAVEENNEDVIKKCCYECSEYMKTLCLPQRDRFINEVISILRENISSAACNSAFEFFRDNCKNIMGLVRFFYAMMPTDKNIDTYIKHFGIIKDNSHADDIAISANAFIMEYGLAALPDLILLVAENRNTVLYNIISTNIRPAWDFVTSDIKFEGIDNAKADSSLYKLSVAYLCEAFTQYGIIPKTIPSYDTTTDLSKIVETNIKMIIARANNENDLEEKLEKYQESYINNVGIYHIMANMMQEAAYEMDSYFWFSDMFESEFDRIDRESKYLSLCEAQYRATGKRPRYISNTYDLDDGDNKKKNDDWINPPIDDKPIQKDEEEDEIPKKKIKPFDFDNDNKKSTDDNTAKNIYNITYQNSFNRNKRMTTKDSYNRTDSDDIYGGKNMTRDEDDEFDNDIMLRWRNRSKTQRKISKTFDSKKALDKQPEDLKNAYLSDLHWTDENIKHTMPWVIMRDTQKNRPRNDIEYRKYLANKIEKLAIDRDIEYDGDIIVAGDTIDGIYDIELTRYNEKYIIDALRKVANAVLNNEEDILKKSKDSSSKNKTLEEAINIFDQMQEFEEAIKGGDPTKDRPLGQRIYNRVEDFNAKAQKNAASFDRGLRTAGEIGNAVVRTPTAFIRAAKNFISDLQNRSEQNLKEDILKDKKLRLRIYGFMRGLINTGLPWVVLGPVWGTLFNIVAIPIRMLKGAVTAIKGGPHRDIMIELREELRIELDIVQDMINKADAAGDNQKKYKLMREKSRMEQEYFKIASKVHFDPIANKRARRGDISY